MSVALQAEPAIRRITTPSPASRPRDSLLTQSPRLRRLSLAQALWSARLGSGVEVSWSPAQAAAHAPLQVRLARTDAAHWRQAQRWPKLLVDLAGQPMAMRLAPHDQWQELMEPAYRELPLELQLAVAAHVTEGLRGALAAALHHAGLVVDEQPPALAAHQPLPHEETARDATPEPALALSLQVRAATAGSSHQTLRALIAIAADAPQPMNHAAPEGTPAWLGSMPLACSLVAAHALLPTTLLSSLLPGDVVLLDPVGASDDAGLGAWIVFAQQAIGRARVASLQLPPLGSSASPPASVGTPPRITFERWLNAEERRAWRDQPLTGASDSMDTQAPHASNLSAALGDTTVSVEAVVDLPASRLAELQSWTEGSVLRTAVPIDGDAVRLRVAGQTVGRGRLVAVDSLIGIEVSELFE